MRKEAHHRHSLRAPAATRLIAYCVGAATASHRADISTKCVLARGRRDYRWERCSATLCKSDDIAVLRSPSALAAALLRSRSPRAPPNSPKRRLQRQRFRRILQGHRIKFSSGVRFDLAYLSGFRALCGLFAVPITRVRYPIRPHPHRRGRSDHGRRAVVAVHPQHVWAHAVPPTST
jgi:hypothetical protein